MVNVVHRLASHCLLVRLKRERESVCVWDHWIPACFCIRKEKLINQGTPAVPINSTWHSSVNQCSPSSSFFKQLSQNHTPLPQCFKHASLRKRSSYENSDRLSSWVAGAVYVMLHRSERLVCCIGSLHMLLPYMNKSIKKCNQIH